MGNMLFLALIIVLVSGLIAYIGDLVGRKMGRKRYTFLGLRPRHTAIVISVFVGMLIALLTLLAALAVSKGIRDAFFTPLGKLKADLVMQRGELKRVHQELTQATKSLTVAQQQIDERTSEISRVNTLLDSSVKQRLVTQRQLRQIQSQVQRQRAELAQAAANLTRTQAEYSRVSNDLTTNRERLANAQLQLEQATDRLLAKTHELLDKTREMNDLRQKETELNNNINTLVSYLGNIENALQVFVRSNFTPLSFSWREEILSGVLPKNQPEVARRKWLEAFFDNAEQVIRAQNKELNVDSRALLFIHGELETLKIIPREDAITALEERLKKFPLTENIIIRLSTDNNVPINGQAFVIVDHIETIADTIAYHKAEKIAEMELSVSDDTTLAEIVQLIADDFIRNQVAEALRKRGVLSVSRRFDPQLPQQIPLASVTRIPWDELINAAQKARLLRGTVKMIARSHNEVSLYGPIAIDIDVELAK